MTAALCQFCGLAFLTLPTRLRGGRGRFCSVDCVLNWRLSDERQDELFWAKVDKTAGCWLWLGSTRHGYGQWHTGSTARGDRRCVMAHRWAYERLVGSIPDGLQIDHLCREKRCVNPAHLEPTTARENSRRATALIVRCPQGHPYDEANTRIDGHGKRVCRACHRDLVRRRRTEVRYVGG